LCRRLGSGRLATEIVHWGAGQQILLYRPDGELY
jgi:hypothetical protein